MDSTFRDTYKYLYSRGILWFDSLSVTPEIHDMYRFLILIRQNLKTPTLEVSMQEYVIQFVSEPTHPPR